jgi:hypothetical protein
MTDRLTPDDLERDAKVIEAATEGPMMVLLETAIDTTVSPAFGDAELTATFEGDQHRDDADFFVAARERWPLYHAEVTRLAAYLKLIAGSLRVADEKEDANPMSATAHRREALVAAEMVVGEITGPQYPPDAARLRGEVQSVDALSLEVERLLAENAAKDAENVRLRSLVGKLVEAGDELKVFAERHSFISSRTFRAAWDDAVKEAREQ